MNTMPLARHYKWMFFVGLILLIVPSALLTYLLSPFPGSQERDAMGLAYVLDNLLPYTLILGVLLVLGQIIKVLGKGKRVARMGMVFFCVFLVGFNFVVNWKMKASSMFGEVEQKKIAEASANKVPLDWVVMGVENNGAATAYPVNYIAYHHRLEDTVGGAPVLVTYCSMCRTGVVFSPVVDGQHLRFRLVGAQHYDAVLEDRNTGTWWYQATGLAAEGEWKGKRMKEIPSRQMTLRAWLALHPNSRVLQPDPSYAETYKHYEGFDTTNAYEKDSTGASERWGEVNWVEGIEIGSDARAYQRADLEQRTVINDQVGAVPVVVALDRASRAVFAWKRTVDGSVLVFAPDSAGRGLRDTVSGSLWDWKGYAVEGPRAGTTLEPVMTRHSYWHAWKTFRPATTQWNP